MNALQDQTPYDDKYLLQQVSEGDEEAFRQLFEKYTPKLKTYFLQQTKDLSMARELVQETFLNIWLYRHSLRDIENPSAYIYRIAANSAVSHFRKENLQRKIAAALPGNLPEKETATLSAMQVKELQHTINLAVEQLPAQQRQVFLLSREKGLSRREIAVQMGLAEKTVRNHLTLSLRAIQEFLRDKHTIYIPLFLLASLLAPQ